MLRLSRAQAQEDTAGYRHEWYAEDNDRIKVETDTFNLDLGLGAKVRATGQLVFDSISGATPTGAPPQSQWPFPTQNDLYKSAYAQAFTSHFLTVSNFNYDNYVVTGLETLQDMTNRILPGVQADAGRDATNSSSSSYQSLTNNPNFRNKTVPLTQMHDFRVAFALGFPITFDRHEFTPSIAYSAESDYVSRGIAFNDAINFNNKNTTLNVGWSANFDIVRDENLVWEHKSTHDFLAGVTQLLTPKSYVTVNFTFGTEQGYLSDPYRGVMAASNFFQSNPDDAALIAEKRPRNRSRSILYLGYNRFFDPLKGGAEVSYRFFHDSWQVNAHTIDLRWNQKIGKRLVVSPMFRYYYQTAATFYYILVPDFNNLPAAYSSDYRLSELNTFSLGLRATYRIHKHLSLDAGYMRYVMRGLDDMTSQSAYPSANIFTVGLRGWF
ncbi:MAG: hypothetical protein JWO95_544 [Verrucomicrobiales bacterium]|nr:hypothetical protein [Verrucomicrobiales bacterium]